MLDDIFPHFFYSNCVSVTDKYILLVYVDVWTFFPWNTISLLF